MYVLEDGTVLVHVLNFCVISLANIDLIVQITGQKDLSLGLSLQHLMHYP